MSRVPFTLPDVGLREIKGMISVEDGYLEIRVNSKILGLIDEDVEVIKIEPSAIVLVQIKNGLFRNKLIITPKKSELLDLIPGDHAASVSFRIKNKYRTELAVLVAQLNQLRGI